MKAIGIYFSDLTRAAQERICLVFRTTPQEENWEDIPLAILEREEGKEEETLTEK